MLKCLHKGIAAVILMWFVTSFSVSADTITIYPNRYRLEIKNSSQSPGLKIYSTDSTTRLSAGMWKRYPGIGWSQEILCDFNISGIPENATITSVNFNYFIDSVKNPPYQVYYDHHIVIYKNTRSWSGTPKYSDLGSQAWPEEDSVIMDDRMTVARGWRNFPDHQRCKTIVQGWLSNPSSNKGLIITNNAFHETFYVKISRVRMTVGYTLPQKQAELKVVPSLSYYALYARSGIDLWDNSKVTGGLVGDSCSDINLMPSAVVRSDIYSGGNVLLHAYAKVYGDATASGWVNKLSGSYIAGFKRDTTPVPQFSFSVPNFDAYGSTIEIMQGETTRVTSPLHSSWVILHDNATMIMGPGEEYYIGSLVCGNNARIVFDGTEKDRFFLNIRYSFTMGTRFKMSFSNIKNPLAVRVNYLGTLDLAIPFASEIYGVYTCNTSNIQVDDSSKVYGSLYGNSITIDYAGQVTRPPVLNDLAHSEVAYGPLFNPYTLRYKAVVPPSTTFLLVTPTPEKENATVTVNGNSPSVPVSLVSPATDIIIQVRDNESGLSTFYTLQVVKDDDYMVHVAIGGPSRDSTQRSSWTNAFDNFTDAIPYAQSVGKEIWVKQDTYSSFYETDMFTLAPGIEIIGGFRGDESARDPKGSVYNTIVSSDKERNDGQISAWPPTESDFSNYLVDNWPVSLYVVSLGKNAKSMRVQGFTLQNGVATANQDLFYGPHWYIGQYLPCNYHFAGIYFDSSYSPLIKTGFGAGIYNPYCSPTIEKCVIKRNWAESGGGGMFSRGSPIFTNCLFKENVVYRNNGAGLLIQYAPVCTLNGCVFDKNEIIPIPGDKLFGGAVFSEKVNITGINSVFTSNISTDSGGAIFCKEGGLNFINCTFSGNDGGFGACAVAISKKAKVSIINTILWDDASPVEMQGDSFIVTYSCIRGGFAGQGNISSDPLFVNAGNPEGEDKNYGTFDDGYKLTSQSPCKNKGLNIPDIEYDILLVPRLYGDTTDIGAYEYEEYSSNQIQFGIMRNGIFSPLNRYDIIEMIPFSDYIEVYAVSYMGRVLRVALPKNKYTSTKNEIVIYLRSTDQAGNPIPGSCEVTINLIKIGEQGGSLFFQSKIDTWGKYILFTSDRMFQKFDNPWAYIIYMKPERTDQVGVQIKLPYNQF